MVCDYEIEYSQENNSDRNNDIESRKNLACFQTYRNDVYGGATLFTGIIWKVAR